MKIICLKCNQQTNPIGLGGNPILFGYKVQSSHDNDYQKSYHLLVASNKSNLDQDIGDLWDSKEVTSDNSIHILYEGSELISEQICFWKVKIKNSTNIWSCWSETASFEMGLIHPGDWHAKWISRYDSMESHDSKLSAPLFRMEFQSNRTIVKARLYICGLGYYVSYINGNRVGDYQLTPSFTRYDKTVLYDTYDILPFLNSFDPNVIGVTLGNGFFNCFNKDNWGNENAIWRDHPKLILQIHIYLDNGEKDVYCSDTNFRTCDSAITFNGIRNGEYYDARLEQKGWNMPLFDDSNWSKAFLSKSPGGIIKPGEMNHERIIKEIKPSNITKLENQTYICDFSQNISGFVKIRMALSQGASIKLEYGEILDENGDLDTKHISSLIFDGEFQTDMYTFSGEQIEEWEPMFVYHGFRYVRITGDLDVLNTENIMAKVVYTDIPETGMFRCSNTLINRIQECARWSSLTNFHSFPTDCPHREKNGWTGDAHLSAEQMLLNFNPNLDYTKWMHDFKDAQKESGQLPGLIPTAGSGYSWGSGPAWDSAIILIPYYMYLYNGDSQILQVMYDNMCLYMDYMESKSVEYLVDYGLGDWCPPKWEIHKDCPTVLTDTGYFYSDSVIMSKISSILSFEKNADKYSLLANNIKTAFEKYFFNEDGYPLNTSMTALSVMLNYKLVKNESLTINLLLEEIKRCNHHIDCGILGAKYLFEVLTDYGYSDVAYKIVNQNDYPGWGYWIAQGATTLWESFEKGSSNNHHMFSDISGWFYKCLAGINIDKNEVAYRNIIIRPNPVGELTWVEACHESMYGPIQCNWKVDTEKFVIEIEVPFNCSADVYFPNICKNRDSMKVYSGKHRFERAIETAIETAGKTN